MAISLSDVGRAGLAHGEVVEGRDEGDGEHGGDEGEHHGGLLLRFG
ncbi:MAG: hypothetical protein QM704_04445 [Anaeromyxobacteraceae bacterium]